MYRATPQRKQKKSKRPLLWIGIFLIVALAVGGGYYFAKHYHKASGPTAAEKAAEKKQNQQTKQDTAKRVQSSAPDTTPTSSDSTSTKPNTTGDSSTSSTSSGASSSTSTTLSANIDRANQTQAGADLSVRATVVGATSGTCQITLSKSGQSSFTKTFPVVVGATSATCGNADIPISNFPASGTWQVKLIIISGSSQSAAVSTQASVQK